MFSKQSTMRGIGGIAAALMIAGCAAGTASPSASAATPTPMIPTPSATATQTPAATPTPTPSSELSGHPDGTGSTTVVTGCPNSPMRVDVFLGSDISCYGKNAVTIQGWLDVAWGIGGVSNGVDPRWLGEEMAAYVLWLKPMNADNPGCFKEDDCVFADLHVKPGSGVTLTAPPRWVEIIGHFDDAAAATCIVARENPFNISKEEAIRICRSHFVVTAVRNLSSAPGK